YFNQDTLENTADATTALPQLDGRRPCFIDFTSPSGYVIPLGILNAYNMTIQEPVITRTNTATVRALYIGGICDYGVTFATYGDPRTASEVLDQLPDAQKQVVVLWQTPPLIPNLNLSYHPDLSAQLRDSITNALLNLAKDEEGRKLLTSAAQEDIQALKIGKDNLYTDIRAYFEASGLELMDFLGK
ncbi:MAG: PhnD/SsuA/transferrin family substrate-binding protein, partial [Anaerolineaceae bacterium]